MEVNSDNSDKKGLLDGRPAYTPPYSPTNEFDNALFHEKGRSPKEVSTFFENDLFQTVFSRDQLCMINAHFGF